MFKLNVFAPDEAGRDTLLSAGEMQALLEGIVKETENVKETVWNPAIFTSQKRSVWCQVGEKLSKLL